MVPENILIKILLDDILLPPYVTLNAAKVQ